MNPGVASQAGPAGLQAVLPHPCAGRRGGLAGVNYKVSLHAAGQCWRPAAAAGNQENGVSEPLQLSESWFHKLMIISFTTQSFGEQ